MQEIEALVLDTLRDRSKENPLTRAELKQIVGTKDRRAREIIESLRSQGYRIVSTASAKGYWLARDEVEYRAFSAEYGKKAYTIMHNIHMMDQYTEGQESINGL